MSKKGGDDRLVYYAFDILSLESFDLRGCRLLDRKRVLHALIEKVKGPIKYSEHMEASGADFYRSACEMDWKALFQSELMAGTSRAAPMCGPRPRAGIARRLS